jgi:hypothetical protein
MRDALPSMGGVPMEVLLWLGIFGLLALFLAFMVWLMRRTGHA